MKSLVGKVGLGLAVLAWGVWALNIVLQPG